MKKIIYTLLSCIILSSCTIISQKELSDIDERNKNVPVEVTKSWFSDSPIFNIKESSNLEYSKADILRCLFQSANKLKDKSYSKLILANKGKNIFYITGDYFKQIGEEFNNDQNPIYLMRTFPENIYNMNGEKAYERWEGGLLGVTSKQMKDLDDLMNKLIE